MEFNPSKCQVVRVTTSRNPINYMYHLHEQVLEVVTSARYLGVEISSVLSWNSHIDRITGNANRTLGFIRRNIRTKLPKVRETAYNTLVRPKLEYASPIWDSSSKKKVLQIEKIQKRAARWTTSDFITRSSVTAMLEKLGWRSLQQRRADARLCLFYRVVYGLVAIPMPEYIQPNIRVSRYCHSMAFCQVHTSADYYKYSFYPLAIVQWNDPPEWVVCLPTLDAFKEAVGKLHHSGAFNFILTLFSPTFNLSSLLTSLSYLALYLIYSSFISAMTAHTCPECLRRRMTVYKERRENIICTMNDVRETFKGRHTIQHQLQ